MYLLIIDNVLSLHFSHYLIQVLAMKNHEELYIILLDHSVFSLFLVSVIYEEVLTSV